MSGAPEKPESPTRPPATGRDVVFLHIPKTAGTSLRNTLIEALPGHTKIFDYGIEIPDVTGHVVDATKRKLSKSADVVALRRELGSAKPLFVSGHIYARKYVEAFRPQEFITFLREPVERIVSEYKHFVRHLNFKGPFAEFYEQPSHINLQSRMLQPLDLNDIGFIGLAEQMPIMIDALSLHLDAPLRMRKDNVGRRFGGPIITARTRARIVELNDQDMLLYRKVNENLADFTSGRRRHERLSTA